MDSSSGLTDELIKGTNISYIPLHIIINGEIDFLDTKKEHEKHDTYKIIADKGAVTTSQASPGELIEKYQEMLEKYDHVIHLSISPNLSGMYQTAVMVSNDDEFKGKVTVFEHYLAANVLKELALKMNQMTQNENLTIEDYKKEVNIWSKKSCSIVIPGDLDRLASGGRAKSVLISILKMLKTKVAIQWGEKPKKVGMGRTVASLYDKVVKAVKSTAGADCKLIFVYSPATSEKLIEQIRNKMNEVNISYTEEQIPSPFTCHAGVETVGFLAIDKKLLAK